MPVVISIKRKGSSLCMSVVTSDLLIILHVFEKKDTSKMFTVVTSGW